MENANNEIELLRNFQEICEVDEETARQLLTESAWNIEAAIHQFFFSQNVESFENQENENQELRQRRIEQTKNHIQPIKSDVTNRTLTWSEWIQALCVIPFRFVYSSFMEIFVFFYGFFKPPPPRRTIRHTEGVTESRQLMRQQEVEYQQSLAIDRARREEREQMEQQKKADEESRINSSNQLEKKKERLNDIRMRIRSELQYNIETASTVVKIRINFPNGDKLEKNFHPQDSLELLFNAVFTHESCPNDFSLFIGYPRRELKCFPDWYREFTTAADEFTLGRTFEDEGILQSDVVLVRDNEI